MTLLAQFFPVLLLPSLIVFANTPDRSITVWAASCPAWRQRTRLNDRLGLFGLGVWGLKGLRTFSVNLPHLGSRGDLGAGIRASLWLFSFSEFSGGSLHPHTHFLYLLLCPDRLRPALAISCHSPPAGFPIAKCLAWFILRFPRIF